MQPFMLSDHLDDLYAQDARATLRFRMASIIALIISALGLFGLASFMAETRTREIGIRKSLGATRGRIVMMISGDVIRVIAAGMLLATPIAWILANRWLDSFAYRTTVGWEAMVGSAIILLATGWLTIIGHALRAANADPARCLRSE